MKTYNFPSQRATYRRGAAAALAFCAVSAFAQTTATSPSPTDSAQSSDVRMRDSQANNVSRKDKHFVMKAAKGGMLEAELGQLAAERAQDPAVKAFGQRMVTDHTKANQQLMALAASKGITLKDEHGKADRHSKKLSSKSGADFDKAYIKMMVEDHDEDVKLFEKEAEDGKDADLRAFASKTLPTLRDHLAQAKALKKSND